VVSHGQGALVATLLDDLAQPEWNEGVPFEVIVTLNIPEDDAWLTRPYPFAVQVLRNEAPKGFGSNHNGAFGLAKGQFFAVVNPDIRLADFRLSALLAALQEPCAGVCAPLVKAPDGTIEDSARRFPTVSRLLRRKLLPRRAPDYRPQSAALPVDWVAGMFLLFPSSIYKLIAGFDERYFMYLEDVEICRNLRRCGFLVLWVGSTAVIHDASRASRRNLRHLGWHVTSAFRYLFGSPRGLPLPEIAAARDGH
jgi:GT2 family glycosyltransferase